MGSVELSAEAGGGRSEQGWIACVLRCLSHRGCLGKKWLVDSGHLFFIYSQRVIRQTRDQCHVAVGEMMSGQVEKRVIARERMMGRSWVLLEWSWMSEWYILNEDAVVVIVKVRWSDTREGTVEDIVRNKDIQLRIRVCGHSTLWFLFGFVGFTSWLIFGYPA